MHFSRSNPLPRPRWISCAVLLCFLLHPVSSEAGPPRMPEPPADPQSTQECWEFKKAAHEASSRLIDQWTRCVVRGKGGCGGLTGEADRINKQAEAAFDRCSAVAAQNTAARRHREERARQAELERKKEFDRITRDQARAVESGNNLGLIVDLIDKPRDTLAGEGFRLGAGAIVNRTVDGHLVPRGGEEHPAVQSGRAAIDKVRDTVMERDHLQREISKQSTDAATRIQENALRQLEGLNSSQLNVELPSNSISSPANLTPGFMKLPTGSSTSEGSATSAERQADLQLQAERRQQLDMMQRQLQQLNQQINSTPGRAGGSMQGAPPSAGSGQTDANQKPKCRSRELVCGPGDCDGAWRALPYCK